jgi:hypothetical protein
LERELKQKENPDWRNTSRGGAVKVELPPLQKLKTQTLHEQFAIDVAEATEQHSFVLHSHG